jgi:plasmid stabilization system protein ParE
VKCSVSLSSRAEADLTIQYRWYLENATVEVAERFLKAFDERARKLSQFPEVGQKRRFRAVELKGVRSISMGPKFRDHLIFYRVHANSLGIERVMHGARDLERRLMEPAEG